MVIGLNSMHNNESLILILGRNIKQALGVRLSEQSTHYNSILLLLPLRSVGAADERKKR